MSRYILPLSILSLSIISASASAVTLSAGGVISISGAISDTTCTINGTNNNDLSIALDPISINDAGIAVGVIAKNQKAFGLTFSNCAAAGGTPGSGNLALRFSSANIAPSGLYIINTSVNEINPLVARNVGFSLVTPGATTTAIQLNTPYDTTITNANASSATGGTVNLVASYYKPNILPAQAGNLQSSIIYTVAYL